MPRAHLPRRAGVVARARAGAALALARATPGDEDFYAGGQVVALLAFGGVAYAAYIVMAIGVGRAKRTQFNWVIPAPPRSSASGSTSLLVPDHGMMGSAIAAAAAYSSMFLGMSWYAQRVYPDAVPVAAGLHGRGRGGRTDGRGQAAGCPARGRGRAGARLSARPARPRLLPPRGAARPQRPRTVSHEAHVILGLRA